ncbi:ankyrin repeat domain-containing protein 16-like [Anthonomus grandis grandis]|uniref:ankyrin repeat domain-containing protein 16-like n=1 Tax=Anthonomus grandis grandis TaxID=2921223 RepID=UPI00216658CE|nr:ankyrin repeat domain-containing protein 16-like [Anthonomus grandis grandis]XP_050302293.1 ankyrin repeat domain-containing protein 16-like [Anthonomus grandis grandis]
MSMKTDRTNLLNKNLQKRILKEIHKGDTLTLQNLKAENTNFHWCYISYNNIGDTALHIAARLGHINIIDYLLQNYSPCCVDIKNKDDKTPLHEAAQFAQYESVLQLCSYGASVNALKRADWTPLMLACTKLQPQSLNIIKDLVHRGAILNVPNKDGWTCNHLLAREGILEGTDKIFEYLVSEGLEVSSKTKNGRTSLHIAALHGNIGLAPILLQYIDIDTRDGCGNTPLHEAILGQHINFVKILIERGADINATNNNMHSCLHLASSQNYIEGIHYLIAHVNITRINDQTKEGYTASHCAARNGHTLALELLSKLGANINIKDNFGRVPHDYLSV